ncbi:hypothetical protein RDABS01_016492 [Bienertia sinuspersici]
MIPVIHGEVALLKEGLILRVGNDSCIRVWADTWIRGEHGGHTLIPSGSHDMGMKVSDLIYHYGGVWNENVVRSIFNEDCQKILAIPLLVEGGKDDRYWWPTTSGEYSVKTGYWMAMMGQQNGAHVNEEGENVWKNIWKMEGPPKLQLFLLQRQPSCTRKAPNCPLCRGGEETIVHATFDCPNNAELWSHFADLELIKDAPSSSFIEKWKWLNKNTNASSLCKISVQNKWPGMGSMEYARRVFGHHSEGVCKADNSWCPPPTDIIKINTDAHVIEGDKVGVGAVL